MGLLAKSFEPEDLGTVGLLFDANQGVAYDENNKVTSWTDQSANNYVLSPAVPQDESENDVDYGGLSAGDFAPIRIANGLNGLSVIHFPCNYTTHKGEWDSESSYSTDDYVWYSGETIKWWKALQPSIGQVPSEGAYWTESYPCHGCWLETPIFGTKRAAANNDGGHETWFLVFRRDSRKKPYKQNGTQSHSFMTDCFWIYNEDAGSDDSHRRIISCRGGPADYFNCYATHHIYGNSDISTIIGSWQIWSVRWDNSIENNGSGLGGFRIAGIQENSGGFTGGNSYDSLVLGCKAIHNITKPEEFVDGKLAYMLCIEKHCTNDEIIRMERWLTNRFNL